MADAEIKHDYNDLNLNEDQKDAIQAWNELEASKIANAAAAGTLRACLSRPSRRGGQ